MKRKEAIEQILKNKQYTYQEYLNRSSQKQGKMKAGYEATSELLKEFQDKLEYINKPMNVILFAENWCGDCANAVPVIARLAEECPNWNFKIFSKDENEDLFTQFFTTAGKRKIPLLLFLNSENYEIARWFERPTKTYKIMNSFRSLPHDEFIQKLRESPEFQVPGITRLVLEEIIQVAEKSVALLESLK